MRYFTMLPRAAGIEKEELPPSATGQALRSQSVHTHVVRIQCRGLLDRQRFFSTPICFCTTEVRSLLRSDCRSRRREE